MLCCALSAKLRALEEVIDQDDSETIDGQGPEGKERKEAKEKKEDKESKGKGKKKGRRGGLQPIDHKRTMAW